MQLLKGIEWTPRNVLKAVVIGIVALVFASFVFSFVRTSFDSVQIDGVRGMMRLANTDSFSVAPQAYYGKTSGGEMAAYDYDFAGGSAGLSVRNVAGIMPSSSAYPPIGPGGGYSTGTNAEEFEVTEYSASIETQDKEDTCTQIADLKSRSYVIFESANEHDRGCDYRFKVEHSRVPEILATIKGLDPKDLSENTYTIKNLVDDFSSETDILTKKRDSIDDTLKDALAAYDEITDVATANQDAESLAKIIDSKIQLIERLTQERININEQLDRLARAKAEQLDRLAYTYFNVSAYENRYLDGEHVADSWKNALRATINDVNTILQEATLGLIALLFLAAQWILYGLIVLFIAKYVWTWARQIWKGKPGAASPARNGSRSRSVRTTTPPETDNG